MVELFLDICIDDSIANSDSDILVYINDNLLVRLNAVTPAYANIIYLEDANAKITLKRKYCKMATCEKVSFFKKTLAYLLSFALILFACAEPLECLRECTETIELGLKRDDFRLHIKCIQEENDLAPRFLIRERDRVLKANRELSISDDELTEVYNERIKFVKQYCAAVFVILAVLSLIAIIKRSLTTLLFSLLIFVVLFICTIYSLNNLNRQYEKLKSGDNTGDG